MSHTRAYVVEQVRAHQISALDLLDEIERLDETRTAYHLISLNAEGFRMEGEVAQMVVWPELRCAGICMGADAVWYDVAVDNGHWTLTPEDADEASVDVLHGRLRMTVE